MKTYFSIILILFLAHMSYGQTDCKPYVPTTKGTKWEITSYSAKGKETGKTSHELIEKKTTPEGLNFTIKSSSFDQKGKEIFTNNYSVTCTNGKFEFDMAFKLDGNMMQAYESMDVDIDATKFEIPSMDTAEGATLDDGSLKVNVSTNGVSMFQITMMIIDRKVEAIEERTTPAGTFNCLKLSQKINTKMMMTLEVTSKEWYAEGIGMVRSESYNKKGKLSGYSELTKLEIN